MQSQENSLSELLCKTDNFIRTLDTEKCSPPFIAHDFNQMRRQAFYEFGTIIKDTETPSYHEKLMLFISKFEHEYIEAVKSKLRHHYVEYILHKEYEIPKSLDAEKLKSLGATNDLLQIIVVIADRLLELESLAYTLEGIELYNLLPKTSTFSDYFEILKIQSQAEQPAGESIIGSALTTVSSFSLQKLGPLFAAKGASKLKFNQEEILQLILKLAMGGTIPWRTMVMSMNLHWLAGGFACSYLLQSLGTYIAKKRTLDDATALQKFLEDNRLHIINQRNDILDLVRRILEDKKAACDRGDDKALAKLVAEVMKSKDDETNDCKKLDLKEEDGFVVIEEKDFEEAVDNTGVVVVEWL